MKKFFTIAFLSFFICLCTGTKLKAQANGIYWTEGFEPPNTISTDQPAVGSPAAPYWATTGSGVWYIYGAYRTTGTSCSNVTESDGLDTIGANHIRLSKNIYFTGNIDSAYIVTPVVGFGVGELHFVRNQASRPYAIYWTSDTGAVISNGVATNWQLAYTTPSSPANIICADTSIVINEPDAKRLKILSGQSNLNYDLDSVWVTSFSTIIPVTFGGISATVSNGVVKISWSIETEINTKQYIIERSSNGSQFSQAGVLTANNASNYSWLDNSPISGNGFYRVKSIDANGTVKYSNIIKVNISDKLPEIVIAPNPVTGGQLKLQLNNFIKGNYTVDVYNTLSQKVFSSSISHNGESFLQATFTLPACVTKGFYNVHIFNSSANFNKNIIVE
jgi:hypothetical protein